MRKIIRNTVFVILISILIIFALFFAYLRFYRANDANLTGEWTAGLDMTQQASAAALGWLQEIEAVPISMQEIEAHMQGLTIELHLTLTQTDRSAGVFDSRILPESYTACSQAAYEAFAAAFQEMLAQRLHMAGYTGELDTDALEALVVETFGMSTPSYLASCVPDLLPPLEQLQAQYDGSGSYESADDILTRQFDNGQLVRTKTERYIRKDSTLIIIEETDSPPFGSYTEHYPLLYTLGAVEK